MRWRGTTGWRVGQRHSQSTRIKNNQHGGVVARAAAMRLAHNLWQGVSGDRVPYPSVARHLDGDLARQHVGYARHAVLVPRQFGVRWDDYLQNRQLGLTGGVALVPYAVPRCGRSQHGVARHA